MSMMDNILGMGRYDYVNESWEPELQDDDFDSIEPLSEGIDPMEFMMESIFNNELNMRNLDTAIMCEEYTYLRENGTEMVYEAGTISTIIEKAKNAIMRIWHDIQKFFRTQIENFTKKSESDFIRKYKSKAAGRYAKIKGFKGLFKLSPDDLVKQSKEAMECFDTIAEFVMKSARGIETPSRRKDGQPNIKITYIDTDEIAKAASKAAKALFGDKAKAVRAMLKDDSGKTFSDLSEFTSQANDAISKMKDEMEVQQYDADTAIKYYSSLTNARKTLRPAYESSKKNIDQYLKTLKRMEAAAKKFKILPTETSSEIHKSVKTVNKLGSCTATVNRFTLKVLNMCKAQYKAIIVTAAAQYNKTVDSKNESYIESVEIL